MYKTNCVLQLMVTIFTQPILCIKNINLKSKKYFYLNLLLVKWKNHKIKTMVSCLYDNYFEEKIILKIIK